MHLNLICERCWARHQRSLDLEQALPLEELLESEVHDLWDMLCGRQKVADQHLHGFIQKLLEV